MRKVSILWGKSFTAVSGYGIADRMNEEKLIKKKMMLGIVIALILLLIIIGAAVIRMVYFDPYSAYYKGNAAKGLIELLNF